MGLDGSGDRSHGKTVVASYDEGKVTRDAITFYGSCQPCAYIQDWLQVLEMWVANGDRFWLRHCQIPFIDEGMAELAEFLA